MFKTTNLDMCLLRERPDFLYGYLLKQTKSGWQRNISKPNRKLQQRLKQQQKNKGPPGTTKGRGEEEEN